MDQDEPQQGPPDGYGAAPVARPAEPAAPAISPAGPTTPGGPTDGRPGPVAQGPRPLPLVTSLAGAAGAVFLLGSLALFLSELNGDSRRLGGLLVCLLFQGLGVGLMVLTRGRASTTTGVGLTALAVIPLVIYLFVDVDNPSKTIDSPSGFTNTATLILLASAAAWLVGYFVGPGRRYGIYLGAALVAMWLVAVVQIVDNPINQIFNPFASQSFGAETKFESVGSAIGPDDYSSDGGYAGGFGENDPYEDDFFSDTDSYTDDGFAVPSQDDFGSGFDDDFDYEDDYMYGDPYADLENPSTKLGWASLVFGGAYLALAAWRDRRGDARMGTPFVAVATPILLFGLAFLSDDFGQSGTAMLAIAIGAAQVFVGTRQGRRFTSWIGLLVATFGVLDLVEQAVGDSARVSAIVLLILGVGVTILALTLDGGLNVGRDDNGPSGPAGPPVPPAGHGDPAANPVGSGAPASAWSSPTAPTSPAGSPWSTPSAPPEGPPTSPPGTASSPASSAPTWQPPAMQAPAAPPWSPSTPDSPSLWAPPADETEPPASNS